jgi:hypothetical protein
MVFKEMHLLSGDISGLNLFHMRHKIDDVRWEFSTLFMIF